MKHKLSAKRFVVAFFAVTFLAVPAVSSAQTSVADLQAQIQKLLALVQQLQAQLAAQGGGAQWCHTFSANLRIGQSGAEVTALQTALQKDGESIILNSSFDDRTASAVTGFQEKYMNDILTPNGLQHGTGYAGSSTRAKLNSLYGCGNASVPVSNPTLNSTPAQTQTPSNPAGALTVSPNYSTLPQNANPTTGSVGNLIGSYSIAASATEGVNVTSIQIAAGSYYFQNLKVYVKGSQVGATQPTVNAGNTYTFSVVTPISISAGSTASVQIFADISTSAAGSVSPATTFAGCAAYGATTNTSVTCNSVNGKDLTFVSVNTTSQIVVQPTSFKFTATQGSASPASPQVLSVYGFNYSWSVAASPNAGWLLVSGGPSPNSNNGMAFVSASTNGLSAGTYTSSVIVSGNFSGSPIIVPVTLTVQGTVGSTQPFVTVLSPNGGETWQIGQSVKIRWQTSGMDQNVPTLLSVMDDRIPNWQADSLFGSSPVLNYATLVSSANGVNTYEYNFVVPQNFNANLPQQYQNIYGGNHYKIEVIAVTGGIAGTSSQQTQTDWSNAPFTITAVPTITAAGALTVSADSNQPASNQIVMGATQVPVASFRFSETSNTESIKIASVSVADTVASILSTNPSYVKSGFSSLNLYNGSTLVATTNQAIVNSAVSLTDYRYTFNFASPVVVPQANSILLVLKGDVASYASSGATDNSIHTFQLSSVSATGQSSGVSIPMSVSPTSPPNGNPQTVLRTKLTVSATPLGMTTYRMNSTVDDLANINFTADPAGAVQIGSVYITFSGSAPTNTFYTSSAGTTCSTCVVQLYDPATGTSHYAIASDASNRALLFDLGNYIVASGSSKSFILRINSIGSGFNSPSSGVSLTLSAAINVASDVAWKDGLDSAATGGLGLQASAVPIQISTVSYAPGTGGSLAPSPLSASINSAFANPTVSVGATQVHISSFIINNPNSQTTSISSINIHNKSLYYVPVNNIKVLVNGQQFGQMYNNSMGDLLFSGTLPLQIPANGNITVDIYGDIASAGEIASFYTITPFPGTFSGPFGITGVTAQLAGGANVNFSGNVYGQNIVITGVLSQNRDGAANLSLSQVAQQVADISAAFQKILNEAHALGL